MRIHYFFFIWKSIQYVVWLSYTRESDAYYKRIKYEYYFIKKEKWWKLLISSLTFSINFLSLIFISRKLIFYSAEIIKIKISDQIERILSKREKKN